MYYPFEKDLEQSFNKQQSKAVARRTLFQSSFRSESEISAAPLFAQQLSSSSEP